MLVLQPHHHRRPLSSAAAALFLLAAASILGSSSAFVVITRTYYRSCSSTSTTRIFLEDDIADMIDRELYRQQHIKEFENEWMEKNKGAVLQSLKDDYAISIDEDELRQNFRQKMKDNKLAKKDPRAYCADRCITTGNCDVYEDIFELSPEEVIKFCTNCVLGEGDEDEECVIPEKFYELMDEIGYETSLDGSSDGDGE